MTNWKLGRRYFIWLLAAAGFGCARYSSLSSDVYQLPWPDSSDHYSLQRVELKSFTSPAQLQGESAHILVDPYVAAQGLTSSTPVGRYISMGDYNVPADFSTLEAVTIYAHLDQLRELDREVGVEGLLHWPLLVGVRASVNSGANGGGANIVNNALFDAGLGALLFVPYNENRLPISINAGVLGHEHFHEIFQAIVLDRIHQKGMSSAMNAFGESWIEPAHADFQVNQNDVITPDQAGLTNKFVTVEAYNSFLLRGLNEGLADFWGWVYSGDPQFLGLSLAQQLNVRRLDAPVARLFAIEVLRENLISSKGLLPPEVRIGRAYRLGTYFARFMYALALHLGAQNNNRSTRLIVAQALMRSLPAIGATVAQEFATQQLSPNLLLAPLYHEIADELAGLNFSPSTLGEICALQSQFAAPETDYEGPEVCRENRPVAAADEVSD